MTYLEPGAQYLTLPVYIGQLLVYMNEQYKGSETTLTIAVCTTREGKTTRLHYSKYAGWLRA